MATQEKKKTEEEILFPTAKVGDIEIKPWSFGTLFELANCLERVLDKAEAKGVVKEFEGDFISYPSMVKLFTLASPEVLEIISLTVGMEQEEVKKWDMAIGVKVAAVIYQQNKETIKNALSPLLSKTSKEGAKKKSQ